MNPEPHNPAFTLWCIDRTGTSTWLAQYDDLSVAIEDLDNDDWKHCDHLEIINAAGDVEMTRQRLHADDPGSFVR